MSRVPIRAFSPRPAPRHPRYVRRPTTQSKMRRATCRLGSSGSSSTPPAGSRMTTRLVSHANPAPSWLTSFATIRSRCLARSLWWARRTTSPVSAAKPTTIRAPTSLRMSGVGSRSSLGFGDRDRERTGLRGLAPGVDRAGPAVRHRRRSCVKRFRRSSGPPDPREAVSMAYTRAQRGVSPEEPVRALVPGAPGGLRATNLSPGEDGPALTSKRTPAPKRLGGHQPR